MKKLHDFAENNKETTGKFTIGDEKVRSFHSPFLQPLLEELELT